MKVTLNLKESQWNALRKLLEQLPQKVTENDGHTNTRMSRYSLQKRILDVIRQWEDKKNGTIPPWRIERAVHFDPVLVDDAIHGLLANGTIEFVRENRGIGRPALGYRIVKN